MERRAFLAGASATALIATGAPAFAQAIPLSRISSYFNALETAEADFTQFNDDGTISSGKLYIRRPGRMRFEYNPPDQALVMAGGGQLAIFDNRSNAKRPEQYPLRQTPLNILLERDVDLMSRDVVVGHSGDATATRVVAQDPRQQEAGWIEFVFADAPVRLQEWVVVDSTGSKTRVVLTNMVTGGRLRGRLFNIQEEIRVRQ